MYGGGKNDAGGEVRALAEARRVYNTAKAKFNRSGLTGAVMSGRSAGERNPQDMPPTEFVNSHIRTVSVSTFCFSWGLSFWTLYRNQCEEVLPCCQMLSAS